MEMKSTSRCIATDICRLSLNDVSGNITGSSTPSAVLAREARHLVPGAQYGHLSIVAHVGDCHTCVGQLTFLTADTQPG
jgi:hypothetical protein